MSGCCYCAEQALKAGPFKLHQQKRPTIKQNIISEIHNMFYRFDRSMDGTYPNCSKIKVFLHFSSLRRPPSSQKIQSYFFCEISLYVYDKKSLDIKDVYEHTKLLLFKLSLCICIQFLMLYINMIYEIIVSKFENSNLSPHDDAGQQAV